MLLGLILVAVWVPTPWLEQVRTIEQRWSRQALGERSAAAVWELAQGWCAAALDAQTPRLGRAGIGANPGVASLIDGVNPAWLADRAQALRLLVELVCRRAGLLAGWAPALGLLLIAGVLEGHWRWRIRQPGFDYPSPVARQASQTGLILMLGLMLLALLLPLPLHPFEIPLLTLIAVRLIGTGITHLPKHL